MAQKHSRIKILFSIPNFDTAGSGKALLKVCQNLDITKFESHIMCQHKRGSFYKVVEASGIPVHVLQYTTKMKPYHKGVWHCFKISKVLRKINPDIIHSFHYAPDYSEALASKMAGIKWVYTKKNMNWGGKSKNGWRLRTLLASAVIAQNTDMVKLFFSDLKKVYLIPRGVDINEFKKMPPKLELKREWQVEDNVKILMCVANLVPVKGIHVLLEAFAALSGLNKDWVIMIVGDYNSDYGLEMVALAKKLRINEQVIFTGKKLNVNDFLSIANVFVLPTLNEGRREGSPLALLEAMSAEKYVLASNISGIKDQLREFPDHLFEAGNAADLEKKLIAIFQMDYETVEKKARVLSHYVECNLTIGHEVSKTEAMYNELFL